MFFRFYDNIFIDIHYPNDHKTIAEEIAYDRTYKHTNYQLSENIVEELSNLKNKYTLIMLTDNWPCVISYMKEKKLYDYFDKIYVSSVYGSLKKDKVFFDYMIDDYHIKPGEALFIDDVEANLDIGKEKGLDCVLMDRYKEVIHSKYKIVYNLYDI